MSYLLTGRRIVSIVQSKPELFVLCLIIMIIGMLVMPLPPVLLDFLIAVNMIGAMLVLMSALHVVDMLSLSTFPALVLLTTLFRLALSISSSRLILMYGHAGQIIQTFGEFVIGQNIVVGLVIFSIVTIAQFIVITKGAERVAEVAARFSLDAMPGKQMSIDADFRAGVIDGDSVRARRSALERESQLYGSFDGAMKFIKGDAIAGILIIFVNLIGGIMIGTIKEHLSISESMAKYAILSVGDALVGQIPALLISMGAGFLVTRIAGSEQNLGHDIVSELLSSTPVLLISSGLSALIGLLPGFPLPVFLTVSASLGFFCWRRWRDGVSAPAEDRHADAGGSALQAPGASTAQADAGATDAALSGHPLVVILPHACARTLSPQDLATSLHARMFADVGLSLPTIVVGFAANDAAASDADDDVRHRVVIRINDVDAAVLYIAFDGVRLVGATDLLLGLGMNVSRLIDCDGEPAEWVMAEPAQLQDMGIAFRDALDELHDQFITVALRNCNEFFGIQETKNLLDTLDGRYPELLKEVYRQLPVQKLCEILRRLLTERVAIRNMKLILETLANWGTREKDSIVLTEHVRIALSRYISHRVARNGRVKVMVLTPDFEEKVRQGIKHTSAGTFLNLTPAVANELVDRITVALNQLHAIRRDFVLLASMDVRRYARTLIESRFPGLQVISFGEVSDNVELDVLGNI
ncbi:EscV/YscV/HrcV family type III secretion system export apparatus protein [Xanthomonas phaseoli pv. phaseoli]|uniref:EscV/YscV/HrcV family type III secretion system export apparatus protein n=1 Tax=Xanthomonas phaseoli TaxID=1985254 RepID=UPI000595C626|nr:EscV/YscV/HrcV family type III secretion system export apparatus protein [Xanthomonas phaseoli]KIJ02874.1 type III secretion system protein InvA [Xanthomonas phaseoli pv. phaseoli]QWN30827.1 EscV/YscV/HrcV family type III secretion system export apparatus protein [Xanthomonas phaseoli pv. phaseoli]UZB28626.1 EscV/YscV/HrcV family type III secretion system export apparatus protein [Xanthomonas phaseoli pv. phaseoli]